MTIILSTLSLVGFEEIATSLTALAMTEYSITLGRSFLFFVFPIKNEKKKK